MIHIRFFNKKNQIFRKLNFYSFLPKPNNNFSIPFIRNRTHDFTWFFFNRLCNFLIEFRPKILFKPINRLVKQAGAELGQAQLKLILDFNQIQYTFGFSLLFIWFGRIGWVGFVFWAWLKKFGLVLAAVSGSSWIALIA